MAYPLFFERLCLGDGERRHHPEEYVQRSGGELLERGYSGGTVLQLLHLCGNEYAPGDDAHADSQSPGEVADSYFGRDCAIAHLVLDNARFLARRKPGTARPLLFYLGVHPDCLYHGGDGSLHSPRPQTAEPATP